MWMLRQLDRSGIASAQVLVTARHYLGKPVDARCSVEGYEVRGQNDAFGVLLVGRPQATACYPWYGSVDDVASGRAEVTRWQVLNLARVYFHPFVQSGGRLHGPQHLPGFTDRHGAWRSALGSWAITELAERVVLEYLLRRPPCFLEEPYELRWLLSYCDTRRHRGALYRASGFELFRQNAAGVQTWRLPLRALRPEEHRLVRAAALSSARSAEHRARRAQGVLRFDDSPGVA